MISFMTPIVVGRSPAPSWLARLWLRYHPGRVELPTPTIRILEIVDRVRGVESQLARLKVEHRCKTS